MPIYQLPNGKSIYLSIEQLLDLTDEDEQYLMSVNAGIDVINPFIGSPLSKSIKEDYIEEEEDISLDYEPDDYEDTRGPINLDDLDDEDLMI